MFLQTKIKIWLITITNKYLKNNNIVNIDEVKNGEQSISYKDGGSTTTKVNCRYKYRLCKLIANYLEERADFFSTINPRHEQTDSE